MKRRYKVTLMFVFVCMVMTYLGYYLIQDGSALAEDVKVIDGQVQLGEIKDKDIVVKLKGEWRYYDRKRLHAIDQDTVYELVSIPENKSTSKNHQFYRYGTYALDIYGLVPNKAYAIYSGSQVTAFNLYANDVLVFSNGNVSEKAETHVSEWKPKAGTIYSDHTGKVTLAVEISNFEYEDGVFWGAMQIGPPDLIFKDYYNKRLVDSIFLLTFLIIFLMLLSILFLVKYDPSIVYYSMFLFIMLVRLSVTSTRPIMYVGQGIPWEWLVRLDYMSGYMILPVFVLVVLSRTPYLKGTWLPKSVFMLCVLIAVFVGLSDHALYSRFLTPYLLVALIVLVIMVVLSVRIYWKNIFVRNIFFMISVNFTIAMICEISGSLISYVPVAIFNAVIAMAAIVLNSFVGKFKENELLAMSAMIDPLTGLYNRMYFEELNEESLNEVRAQELYILFLDLDGFKAINDSYGHEEGDYILQTISRRLRQSLRHEDIVIRYGGDEFIILLNLKKDEDIHKAAHRILDQIKIVENSNSKHYQLSASIGIVRFDISSGLSLEDYVRLSDQAMYRVKEEGGGAYVIV